MPEPGLVRMKIELAERSKQPVPSRQSSRLTGKASAWEEQGQRAARRSRTWLLSLHGGSSTERVNFCSLATHLLPLLRASSAEQSSFRDLSLELQYLMGIPKFYRWLSERYPLLNQFIGSDAVPEIDNLYLDMNGIFHNCTHGNDPGRKLTEEEMVLRIFNYLEKLFELVKPKKLMFMAIDGVAPRAKMNQQRSRRFRAAKEAAEAKLAKERKGEPVDPATAFDSNCITPGTPFMARLQAHLSFFIRKKILEDPAWQKPQVILSGHNIPGEGEHKIMEHIRISKNEPGYEPNQRHCLYGLDADLIMLSLVTHEPCFCLLREVVSYSGGGRGQPIREALENPGKEHFILFHIGLMRDYLQLELQAAGLHHFNVERVIDDLVLFCMLVGNDFLPSLPTLDIGEGALNRIFTIYKQQLAAGSDYLTRAGCLNPAPFESLLQTLAGDELETLEQRASDAEYFESKKSKRGGGRPSTSQRPVASTATELDDADAFELQISAQLRSAGQTSTSGLKEAELEPSAALEASRPQPAAGLPPTGPTMMNAEARNLMLSGQGAQGLQLWKNRYYAEKLEIDSSDPQQVRKAAAEFIRGIHWVLAYYYRGVASWDWFFPYHFAPTCSDLTAIGEVSPHFKLGEPFLPYWQLLAVLPAGSKELLPKPYQVLMTDPNSPIIGNYPLNFRIDQEGKRNDWEGVVCIPFIDVQLLLHAAHSIDTAALSQVERDRNSHGHILLFSHDKTSTETAFCESGLPGKVPSLQSCNSRCQRVLPRGALAIDQPGFEPMLRPGTLTGRLKPHGFPSIETLPVVPEIQQAGVNVFGQPSKRESLILHLKAGVADEVAAGRVTVEQVAQMGVGTRCWVYWPYLKEALICGASTQQKVIAGKIPTEHGNDAKREWVQSAQQISHEYLSKRGIDVGRCAIMVHVRPVEGLVRQLDGTLEKRFAKQELQVPLQASLRRHPKGDDPEGVPGGGAGSMAPALHDGSKALFLGRAHYGCVATVIPPPVTGRGRKGDAMVPNGYKRNAMLCVTVEPAAANSSSVMAHAHRIIKEVRVRYMPTGQVARSVNLSPSILGRIAGSLWVDGGDGRADIGLCVKNAPKAICVPDYAMPSQNDQGWVYTDAFVQLLTQYKARFSWVFQMIANQAEGDRKLAVSDAFPDLAPEACTAKLQEVQKWLKSLPFASRPLVKTTSVLAPEAAVRTLQNALPPQSARAMPAVQLENVSPSLLLPPAERGGVTAALAGGFFELGDRVASLRAGSVPPLGVRGTIVGIYEDACEVLFDTDFTGGTSLNGRCLPGRGLIMSNFQLLNLSKPHAIPASGASAPRILRNKRVDRDPIEKVRQPLGPPKDGSRGFAAGRGKPLPLPGSTALAPGVQPPIPLTTPDTSDPDSSPHAILSNGLASTSSPPPSVPTPPVPNPLPAVGAVLNPAAPASTPVAAPSVETHTSNETHAYPPGLASPSQQSGLGATGAGMTRHAEGSEHGIPAPQANHTDATSPTLLQNLLRKGSAPGATDVNGTGPPNDMPVTGPSHPRSAAPAATDSAAPAAAGSGSNRVDLLAQLLAGRQIGTAPRPHTPPPGFSGPPHPPITPHSPTAAATSMQQPAGTTPSGQQQSGQPGNQRPAPHAQSLPVGRLQTPPGLSPLPTHSPAVPAGQQGTQPTPPAAAQDGMGIPDGGGIPNGSNLLALLQQQGQGSAAAPQLSSFLQARPQQQQPQQPGLHRPAAVQQLQQHIAELVQRAVPGLPYNIQPWQVRVLPGGMAAEVVGLPHQPQASFRVPEPVIAEAHHRLRADQLAQQQRAQVNPVQHPPQLPSPHQQQQQQQQQQAASMSLLQLLQQGNMQQASQVRPQQPQPQGMPALQPAQPRPHPSPQDLQGQDLLLLLQHQHRLRHGGHFPGGPTTPQPAAAGPHSTVPGHNPIGQIPNGQLPNASAQHHLEAFGQPGSSSHQPHTMPVHPGGMPVQGNGTVEGQGRFPMPGPPGAQGPGGIFGQPGGNLAQLFQAAQLQDQQQQPHAGPAQQPFPFPQGSSMHPQPPAGMQHGMQAGPAPGLGATEQFLQLLQQRQGGHPRQQQQQQQQQLPSERRLSTELAGRQSPAAALAPLYENPAPDKAPTSDNNAAKSPAAPGPQSKQDLIALWQQLQQQHTS
ncbi:hypothetical protein WJX74_007152 [Apatococcus lobatus]|uniref:Uncharacterized protein n=1 Tax=Apatococcus lobatus TaxID=904363 RepID=A0AAW1SBB1_9CHLO